MRRGLSTADGSAPRGAIGIGLLVLLAVATSMVLLAGSALAAGTTGSGAQPTAAEYAEAIELGEEHREAEEAGAVAEPTGPLGDTEALALAEEAFSPQLEAAAGIFDELEIDKPLTEDAAVVEAPGPQPSGWAGAGRAAVDLLEGNEEYEGPALLESSVPLQTPDALGLPAPVDLGLEEAGEGLAPANPLAELWIPGELGEGVALPEAGVRLTFPGAAPSSEAMSSAGAEALAFYPNAAPETDLALSPTPEGVETFSVLRTAEAPKSTVIELAMRAGEELQATTNGGAEVLEGGQTKLLVPAPHASDAPPGKAVPASLAVQGDTITVSAEPTADAQYPILLDPPFIENFDSTNGSWSEIEAWTEEFTNQPAMRLIPYSYSQGPSRPGLDMDAGYLPPGPVENPGDRASWFYYVPRFFSDLDHAKAPPTSFVNRMGSSYVDFRNLPATTAAHPSSRAGSGSKTSAGSHRKRSTGPAGTGWPPGISPIPTPTGGRGSGSSPCRRPNISRRRADGTPTSTRSSSKPRTAKRPGPGRPSARRNGWTRLARRKKSSPTTSPTPASG